MAQKPDGKASDMNVDIRNIQRFHTCLLQRSLGTSGTGGMTVSLVGTEPS